MMRYKIETERADLFDINMMIAMSVTVLGIVTHEQIETAFKNAVSSYEILNTRVVIEPNGEAFYESYNLSENSVSYTNKPLSELMNEQEKKRFHIEKGEYIRLFVFDDMAGKLQLHFLMHHLGGDGKSLCYFIENFMKSLSGEKLNKSKIGLLNKMNLPSDSRLPFWMKLYIKNFNHKWEKEKRVFDFADMETAYKKFWNTHQTRIELVQMNEEEVSKKLGECHKNHVGFTSYFIAEQLEKCSLKQDIGLAVDGRYDRNRLMGNQATGISVKHKYNCKKSLLENASQIDKKLKKKLSNNILKYFILHFMAEFEPTLLDAVNLEYAGTFHSRTSKSLAGVLGYGANTKDLSVTNLTVLDIPVDYGNYQIDSMWFIPPVISYGKNVIGIVTVNDRMYISKHQYLKSQ